eukprot:TRINITY_DN48962_c0_g1_i1.p1 TRINITY_DN48962_c0_g1~~TRINITY_DN48962_c0_g1_i1.p1  ORF type:complete len:571 (-),score=119.85 TRINITY_DN48962_c0_g1_i1:32-1744(-)
MKFFRSACAVVLVWSAGVQVASAAVSAVHAAISGHGSHDNIGVTELKTDFLHCKGVLHAAWAALEREPCGFSCNSAAKALSIEALSGRCGPPTVSAADAATFQTARRDFEGRLASLCGRRSEAEADAYRTSRAAKLRQAEQRLQKLAASEVQRLAAALRGGAHAKTPEEQAADVPIGELEARTQEVAGGMNALGGAQRLAAMQTTMGALNLTDVSRQAALGGVHLRTLDKNGVVTAEDIRMMTASALGQRSNELTLQENPPSTSATARHRIVQGDMRVRVRKLPHRTKMSFVQLLREQAGRIDLGIAGIAAGKPWPQGRVPYCFAPSFNRAGRRAVEEALAHLRNTPASQCIAFEEVPVRDDGAGCSTAAGVLFQGDEEGCWSDVGYHAHGSKVNLGLGCEVKGIALHEIGHCLGMDHEQSRPDRDQFVNIHPGNIRPGMEDQFVINPNAYTLEPYDYLSIMHYPSHCFSKDRDNLATITTKSGSASSALGQAMGFSESDIKQLGDMYCPSMPWVAEMSATLKQHRAELMRRVEEGDGTPLSLDGRSSGIRVSASRVAGFVTVTLLVWFA